MRSEIVMPLPCYRPNDIDDLAEDIDEYQCGDRFIRILRERGYIHPKIVDLNLVIDVLTGVVSQYRSLLKLADAKLEFFAKARVLNSWRVVPFVDSVSVVGEFEQHRLPMILDSRASCRTAEIAELLREKEAISTGQAVSP